MTRKFTVLVAALAACGLLAGVSSGARKKTEKAPVKEIQSVPAASGELLDPTNSVIGWDTAVDQGSKIELAVVRGKSGNAIQATFTLDPGGWIAFSKRFTADFTKAKAIRFVYKGEGSINSIELKLENPDQGQFGVLLSKKSNESAWTTVEVPLSDFKYWWGGSSKDLQLSKPLRLFFAISKKEGDDGMSGKISVCQLELVK